MSSEETGLGPLGLLPSFRNQDEPTLDRLRYLEQFDMQRERAVLAKHPLFKLDHRLIPLVEREFKRFLSLPMLFKPQKYRFSPTPPVDMMWHELIIDTKRYFAVCDRIFGTYMHHHPFNPGEISEIAGEKIGYTKECLREAYGGITPAIWGQAHACDIGTCFD